MKKILLYSNRKCDPTWWDVSTPELEDSAFLALFKILDDEWQVYDEISMPAMQKPALAGARQGIAAAAKNLLRVRRWNEYENWQILTEARR